jgi:hypothetical protein
MFVPKGIVHSPHCGHRRLAEHPHVFLGASWRYLADALIQQQGAGQQPNGDEPRLHQDHRYRLVDNGHHRFERGLDAQGVDRGDQAPPE